MLIFELLLLTIVADKHHWRQLLLVLNASIVNLFFFSDVAGRALVVVTFKLNWLRLVR